MSTTTRRAFLRQSLAMAGVTSLAARSIGGQTAPHAKRVFAAGPPAAVLVYVLAPEALMGWPSSMDEAALAMLGQAARRLPTLGRLAGRGSTVSLERLVALAPDLVLDVGNVDATHSSMAERVRSQTGLRYELLDGRLADSGAQLRRVAGWLNLAERGEQLAAHADRLIARVTAGRGQRASRRLYLARGADGLETGLTGSINVEVLEFVGARNVAASAGAGRIARVSLEQVIGWDPEVIVTQDAAFARTVRTDPVWRTVRAVRESRIWLAPIVPFGWLDGPPGVNRLIGALWLAQRLDAAAPAAIRDDVRAFYDAFYRVTLSPAEADRLLDIPA